MDSSKTTVARPDRPRILVVDDEPGPRESLRMILSPDSAVHTCASGTEALDWLRRSPIDLVTVDLNMPGMKGGELVRSIRSEFPLTAIIIVTGYGSLESAVDGIRAGVSDYLTKPFDVVQVTSAVQRALFQMAGRRRLVRFLEGVGEVLGRNREAEDVLAVLERDPEARSRLRNSLDDASVGSDSDPLSQARSYEFLEVLAETIEQRDVHMLGHARRTAYYSALLAEHLCLGAEEREQLRLASFLHDIGKVGLPTNLLTSGERAQGESRRLLETHPEIGERLVKPLGFAPSVASTIRHHHEWYDGGGYPDGLAGDEISLAARIVAVAEAFDAMTCDRPYQASRSEQEALGELLKEAGRQFDPRLVGAFAAIVESGVGLADQRSDGEVPGARRP